MQCLNPWTQRLSSRPARRLPSRPCIFLPKPKTQGRPQPPVKLWDLCVDNFIGMVQRSWRQRRHVKRVLLHTLDKIIWPLDQQDYEHHQEPASVKKIQKGNAMWATRKIILGWILDTIQLTAELPAHRIMRLFQLLDSASPHLPPYTASAPINGNSWSGSSAPWSS
jgi:hypothetical protein